MAVRKHGKIGRYLLIFTVLSVAVGMGGCSTSAPEKTAASAEVEVQPVPEQPDAAAIPFSQYCLSSEYGGHDPIEGFNRTIFYCVDFFTYWIYRPVGYVYGSIMPRWGVIHINNLTDNLEFPRRFLASLLEARFQWAGEEFLRFLTNSSLGIAGLFDPAWNWFGLARRNEDFGLAFASWGIGPGCVIYLQQASNIRDMIGMIFDYAADPKTYFYGGQAFTFLNRGMDSFAAYDNIRRSQFDSYQALKDYRVLLRGLQETHWQEPQRFIEVDEDLKPQHHVAEIPESSYYEPLPEYYSQGTAVDTLRAGWMAPTVDSMWTTLSLWNGDFARMSRERSFRVKPEQDAPEITCRYWVQKQNPKAPLVLILPGLGGHYTASMANALAQLAHLNGMAAMTISNPLNWEFYEAADDGLPPGYTPDDVRKIRMVLAEALKAYRADKVDGQMLEPAEIRVIGYSQGGLNALFLADLERRDPQLGITRFVAVNPPVDQHYGLQKLDSYYRNLDGIPADDAVARILVAAGGYIYSDRSPTQLRINHDDVRGHQSIISDERYLQVAMEEPEATVLIGYSFRRTLEDLLVCMHHRGAVPALKTPYRWGNRQALYEELASWNYERYLNEVVIPAYLAQGKEVSVKSLADGCSLTAIRETLEKDPRVRVLHTRDDFLENQEHREFLYNILGDRITFFAYGGHLGAVYRKEFCKAIIGALTDAATAETAVLRPAQD